MKDLATKRSDSAYHDQAASDALAAQLNDSAGELYPTALRHVERAFLRAHIALETLEHDDSRSNAIPELEQISKHLRCAMHYLEAMEAHPPRRVYEDERHATPAQTAQ